MGMALWCDEGDHAFSEKADSMTGTRKTTKNGRTEVVDWVVCNDCMEKKDIAKKAPAAIAAAHDVDAMDVEDEPF